MIFDKKELYETILMTLADAIKKLENESQFKDYQIESLKKENERLLDKLKEAKYE